MAGGSLDFSLDIASCPKRKGNKIAEADKPPIKSFIGFIEGLEILMGKEGFNSDLNNTAIYKQGIL